MEESKEQLKKTLDEKVNDNFFDILVKYKESLSILTTLSFLIGVVVIFKYLFFDINYLPSSLSFNDSANYLFISLGFGILYSFFVLISILSVLFLVPSLSRRHLNASGFFSCLLFFVGLCFLISIITFFIYEKECLFILGFLVSFSVYLLVIYYSFKLDNPEIRTKFFLGALIFLIPFVVHGVFNKVSNIVLNQLNIKNNSASIVLSDSEFLFINSVFNEYNLSFITSCNIRDKNKIIHDVNILWSIGEESLIEIYGGNGEFNKKIRFTVNNKDIRVIGVNNPKKCIFKDFRNIFTEGSYSINNNESLSRINAFIEKYNNLDKITVYGISDLKPYKKKGNKKLSEERAQSIKKHLSKNSKYKLSTEGLANFEYSPYCKKNILDEKDLRDCEGFNRGVILKLELKQDNTENEAVKNEAVKNESVKNESVKNESVKNEVVTNDYDHYNRVPCCR